MKPIKTTHNRYRHGMRRTRFYRIWTGMKTRCLNDKHIWFKHYGGKGIKVCNDWLLFDNFLLDMHASYLEHSKKYGEKNTSIDRINGNKNYCKENCKWATKLEQSNNAINNRFIEYRGEKKSIKEWSSITGISYNVIYNRIFLYKLSIEETFNRTDEWRHRPRRRKLKKCQNTK